jgi:hypothetical protein
MMRDELTPAEREAFDALPREGEPSRILEERTVRALKERGLIHSGRPWSGLRVPWVAAGIAAAVALFVSGLAVGQGVGARQTANALASLYPNETARAAARVQSTGSAHQLALADLVEVADEGQPEDAALAREVALAALWSAAAEIVRLAPDDPMAARILHEFEREGSEQRGAEGSSRNVVWF